MEKQKILLMENMPLGFSPSSPLHASLSLRNSPCKTDKQELGKDSNLSRRKISLEEHEERMKLAKAGMLEHIRLVLHTELERDEKNFKTFQCTQEEKFKKAQLKYIEKSESLTKEYNRLLAKLKNLEGKDGTLEELRAKNKGLRKELKRLKRSGPKAQYKQTCIDCKELRENITQSRLTLFNYQSKYMQNIVNVRKQLNQDIASLSTQARMLKIERTKLEAMDSTKHLEEESRMATQIQAAYRGWVTRTILKRYTKQRNSLQKVAILIKKKLLLQATLLQAKLNDGDKIEELLTPDLSCGECFARFSNPVMFNQDENIYCEACAKTKYNRNKKKEKEKEIDKIEKKDIFTSILEKLDDEENQDDQQASQQSDHEDEWSENVCKDHFLQQFMNGLAQKRVNYDGHKKALESYKRSIEELPDFTIMRNCPKLHDWLKKTKVPIIFPRFY